MQQLDKKYMFEEMPVRKAIMTMAVPTIISQLVNLVYNVVDTFYIGRTGNPYMIASVTVSYTLFIMTISLSNMFGNGGGSQMARLTGIGENQRAKTVSSYAFYGAIVIAAAYSVLCLVLLNPLLKLFGASSETIGYAKQYVIFTVIIGGIPTILSATMAHLLRNSGNARQASIGLSGGGILNIILDPLFMFVLLPSGYEVMGAAIATMLSNLIACFYLFIVYRKNVRSSNLECSLKVALSIDRNDRKMLFSVGIPSALLTAMFDIANINLNALVAKYGDFALAAHGIVHKVERLPNAICIGFCQATLPLIAYNYSSGNRRRMDEIINTTRKLGLLVCACSIVLMFTCARPITSVFVSTKGTNAQGAISTIAFATSFLRIRCFQSPLQFLNYQSSYSMQAMGDGRDTLIHAFIRELVFYIPAMYLMNYLFGLYGLISAVLVGESLGGIFALILLGRLIRNKDVA